MLTDQEICQIYTIDEDDSGMIEDAHFLRNVISQRKVNIDPCREIENLEFKLKMISSRIQSDDRRSYKLKELMHEAFANLTQPISECLDIQYPSDEADDSEGGLIEAALKRFPRMYIAKAKLDMLAGIYMPGAPLMIAFGEELAVQLNQRRKGEALLGRQISQSNPTIFWGYEWSKAGHWVVNVVMYLNLDVFKEPGRFFDQGSLAHRVRNAWAYALNMTTMEAQELIEFDAEDFMYCISGGDSVVRGEVLSEEESEDEPYFFANMPSGPNSYKYNFPLKGAAYFEPT